MDEIAPEAFLNVELFNHGAHVFDRCFKGLLVVTLEFQFDYPLDTARTQNAGNTDVEAVYAVLPFE